MSYLAEATEALKQAESALRGIVARAASNGDYGGVVQIASWAQAVHDIVGGKPSPKADAVVANGNRVMVVRVKAKPATKETKDEYPKFFRRGDQLVRVAWSKRDRSEYQHKTSKAVVKKLAEALAVAGQEGRVFATDDILPVQDEDPGQQQADHRLSIRRPLPHHLVREFNRHADVMADDLTSRKPNQTPTCERLRGQPFDKSPGFGGFIR